MSLEQRVAPEGKKMLKQQQNTTIVGTCQRNTAGNWKSSHWPKLEQLVQQNKMALDYKMLIVQNT